MRRGTTPTITATVDADLTGFDLHLAFSQNFDLVFEKTGAELSVSVDGDVTTVECALTQEDTLKLSAKSRVEVQLRAVTSAGAVAVATDIAALDVERILQDGVLVD